MKGNKSEWSNQAAIPRSSQARIMIDAGELRLVAQGAEGRIYDTIFLTKPTIIKERLTKRYREPTLDRKINKHRLLLEARCMFRCAKSGILTPAVYMIDVDNLRLYIEKIDGTTIKDLLRRIASVETTGPVEEDRSSVGNIAYPNECLEWAKKIGIALGKMHDIDIVHGDLTTSNMMLNSSGNVVIIDFGLAGKSTNAEDKAVDLYVLERAFISTHPGSEEIVKEILQNYIASSAKSQSIIQRLEQVRLRGRKRDMFG